MTEELAGFLAASRWQDIPAPIRREGARAILNIAGCVVAGRDDPGVGILARRFPGEYALLDAAAATRVKRVAWASALALDALEDERAGNRAAWSGSMTPAEAARG